MPEWTCGGYCNGEPGVAVETHWRFRIDERASVWGICNRCVLVSREADRSLESKRDDITHLHLPIVQPVVGSEQAIAMEVALHAACRLLRTQADATQAERDEAEQTLELLRAAQAEAWLRRAIGGKAVEYALRSDAQSFQRAKAVSK